MLAGFAAADITPPTGSLLGGFIARLTPSTGVDVPLCARALWLEDPCERCLIIGLDLLGLSSSSADRMVAELAALLDLSEDRVILACSHTHSAPMTTGMRGIGRADQQYLLTLRERICSAAAAAAANKRPVRVFWGTAPVEIGVNRREVDPEDGTVVLGRNPQGPRDRTVRVMHLVHEDLSIVLFTHACHPYCLGGDSSLISPDFPGHAAAELANRGHQAIYLNGCSGNLSPQLAFQGPKAARAAGRKLADAVLDACDRGRLEREPRLRIGSTRLQLPHDDLPPLEQIQRDLEKEDRTVRQEEKGNQVIQARIRAAWDEWLKELKQVVHGESDLPPLPARVSVARVGSGAIVALPGEVFFDIGQRIAAGLDADPVCMAAYCHGYIGYVPDPEAFAMGGYEVEEAHRYLGIWRVSPRAEAILTSQVNRLWKDLGGQPR